MAMARTDLRGRLQRFDFREHCARHPGTFPDYQEVLLRTIAGPPVEDLPSPEEIIWFHATRVARTTAFEEMGLLPLSECLDALQGQVARIVDALGIGSPRGERTTSYLHKLELLDQQGPCAFLLRDAALGRGPWHRNFLKSPEIVDDIAEDLAGDRWHEVLEVYQSGTTPCLVAFRSRKSRPDTIVKALAYCHASLHGHDDPAFWNTSFEGGGCGVPPGDIVAVDWLDG